MSAEENKAIARRYWDEGWGTGNVAMIDEIFGTFQNRAKVVDSFSDYTSGIAGWRHNLTP